eukprot:1161282-Pelagomonas_calceolata.AAC.15
MVLDAPPSRCRLPALLRHVQYLQALPEPQWLQCDIRTLDMPVLGKFGVIMADPPWQGRAPWQE